MSNRVAKIEECVKKGQTGSAIRYALGPKNQGFDLSSLRIDEEEVTDQELINSAATEHMRQWFEERPSPCGGCLGGPKAVWDDMFAPVDEFLRRTADSGIPEALRRHMCGNFQKKPVAGDAATKFADEVALAPTIEEWMGRVKSLPKKSAAGPSGLSYDMIQSWPL